MPRIFQYTHVVGPHEIDALEHANNVAYVEWMQAAALAHSAAQGWPEQRYRELGCGWVVRAHAIEYLRPSSVGDRIVVETWVATMKKVTSVRRYRILRQADGELLATAETTWAFVRYATGEPTRILPEVAQSFQVVDRWPAAS